MLPATTKLVAQVPLRASPRNDSTRAPVEFGRDKPGRKWSSAHRRLGRAEGCPRDHDDSAQPRRGHGAGGADIPDVRRGRREVITENPYRFTRDTRGIGFVIADAIAMKLGIERTAFVRVRAGISHALAVAMEEGHCGLPEQALGPLAARLLEVPVELIRTALDLEHADGTAVAHTVEDRPCIFFGGLHHAGRAIAEQVQEFGTEEPAWPQVDADEVLPWLERRTEHRPGAQIGRCLPETYIADDARSLREGPLTATVPHGHRELSSSPRGASLRNNESKACPQIL